MDKRIKARKREQEQDDANKEEGAKRRKLVHKRVGEKWGEISQPTQMGALCSPKGGAEGDTLPPSREQGKNIIPTPSKMSQQLLTKWLKSEREPPELTDNRNTKERRDQDEKEKDFGEEEPERQPGEETDTHTGVTPIMPEVHQGESNNTTTLITEQSIEITTETSSGEKMKDQCEYTARGVCKLHNRRGEKYIETKTEWRDRGGGRGFGNVYKRKVKYRCRTDKF